LRNKVNEWQEFSLKKDVEKISKTIEQTQTENISIVVDLVIAIVALLLDELLSPDDTTRTWAFWGLFVPCVALFLWHIFKCCKKAIKKHNTKYNVFNVGDLINNFDNEICYYVMMADSYNQMLKKAVSHRRNKNIAEFYYIETWYCINKAKVELFKMLCKTKSVFTNDHKEVIKKNKIFISRLINIIMIIEDIRISTNSLILNQNLVINDESMIDMNIEYDLQFKSFVKEINDNFSNQADGSSKIIPIDFSDINRFVKQ